MKQLLLALSFLAVGYDDEPVIDGCGCSRDDFRIYTHSDFEKEVSGTWEYNETRSDGTTYEMTLDLSCSRSDEYCQYKYKSYDSKSNQKVSYTGSWFGRDNKVILNNGIEYVYTDGKLKGNTQVFTRKAK